MKTALDARIDQKEQELEHMTREVDALVKQRKDLRRFLDIDRETAELARVKAAMDQVKKATAEECVALREATAKEIASQRTAQQQREAEVAKREAAVDEQERNLRDQGERRRAAWINQQAETDQQQREIASARKQFAEEKVVLVNGLRGVLAALGAT